MAILEINLCIVMSLIYVCSDVIDAAFSMIALFQMSTPSVKEMLTSRSGR